MRRSRAIILPRGMAAQRAHTPRCTRRECALDELARSARRVRTHGRDRFAYAMHLVEVRQERVSEFRMTHPDGDLRLEIGELRTAVEARRVERVAERALAREQAADAI